MSRKWERMVVKNSKTVNRQRVKQGKGRVVEAGSEAMEVFQGRSWMMSMFLIGFSIFFMTAFGGVYQGDTSYWITVALYFLLGLFIFFVRRPVLRIGKTKLSSRRFRGNTLVKASDIEAISMTPNQAVIQLKGVRARWVFSKRLHLFDMEKMNAELRDYAKNNNVTLKEFNG